MSKFLTLAAMLIAASVPALSQAADFNLTGGSGTTAKVTLASGGITLNVTGPSLGGALDVTRNATGVGVSVGLDASGIGNGESLTLTFSQMVDLSSLRLADWDLVDKATLTWSGGSAVLLGDGLISTDTETLTGAVGTVFTLTGNNTLTSFKLNGLTAVAAVPETSTYVMMALGLAGIGWAARRRQA
jgi:hypothetical protein